jgi:hypothetical protein
MQTILFDVGGPGLLLVLLAGGAIALVIALVVIVAVETAVLFVSKWGTFRASLVASLVMNVASGIVGFAVAPLFTLNVWVALIASLALSILIEGGILMLFKRGAAGLNWRTSLIANTVTYIGLFLVAAVSGVLW